MLRGFVGGLFCELGDRAPAALLFHRLVGGGWEGWGAHFPNSSELSVTVFLNQQLPVGAGLQQDGKIV